MCPDAFPRLDTLYDVDQGSREITHIRGAVPDFACAPVSSQAKLVADQDHQRGVKRPIAGGR